MYTKVLPVVNNMPEYIKVHIYTNLTAYHWDSNGFQTPTLVSLWSAQRFLYCTSKKEFYFKEIKCEKCSVHVEVRQKPSHSQFHPMSPFLSRACKIYPPPPSQRTNPMNQK